MPHPFVSKNRTQKSRPGKCGFKFADCFNDCILLRLKWKAVKQGQLNVVDQVKRKIINKKAKKEKEEEAERLRKHNDALRRKIAEVS